VVVGTDSGANPKSSRKSKSVAAVVVVEVAVVVVAVVVAVVGGSSTSSAGGEREKKSDCKGDMIKGDPIILILAGVATSMVLAEEAEADDSEVCETWLRVAVDDFRLLLVWSRSRFASSLSLSPRSFHEGLGP
jgi:hypothetical protein